MWDIVFKASQPALLSSTDGEGKTMVSDKFHDYKDLVPVQQ